MYALSVVLRERGVFDGNELRDAIERIPPGEYLSASYYERWFLAMETLLAEKGLVGRGVA